SKCCSVDIDSVHKLACIPWISLSAFGKSRMSLPGKLYTFSIGAKSPDHLRPTLCAASCTKSKYRGILGHNTVLKPLSNAFFSWISLSCRHQNTVVLSTGKSDSTTSSQA